MSARQALQCLHLPLLHSVWPGTAAAGAATTRAVAAAARAAGAGMPAYSGTLQQSIWRGLAAGTATGWPGAAAAAAWSSSRPNSSPSSSSSSTGQGAPPAPKQPMPPQAFQGSFKSPIRPLDYARGKVVYLPQLENNVLGRALLTLMGAYERKQQLRNGASVLFQALTEAAENTELQEALGMEVGTFMTPFNLLSLHMWLVINRLDQEPDNQDSKAFRDMLYHDYFFKDIERRVFAHGVQIRVSKWVDQLQKQFYGTCWAYDKALRIEGGVTAQQQAFVGALVKNIYNGEQQNKPWAELLARYLCRELQCLEKTDIETIYEGQIRFSYDIVKH